MATSLSYGVESSSVEYRSNQEISDLNLNGTPLRKIRRHITTKTRGTAVADRLESIGCEGGEDVKINSLKKYIHLLVSSLTTNN